MQLSIVIPTNRSDLMACSRILQACSWAGPNLEAIVRDNSGDETKRNLIRQSQKYFNYWNAMLGKGSVVGRQLRSAAR